MRHIFLLLACLLLTSCGQGVDVAQSRLCRLLLPALNPDQTKFNAIDASEDADGHGIYLRYEAQAPQNTKIQRTLHCRFDGASNETSTMDIVEANDDGRPLSDAQLYLLKRFWLRTTDAEAADPGAFTATSHDVQLSAPFAYFLQQAINGVPLIAIYGLLAAAYSLVYGLVGRINLAFGEFAILGGYAALFGIIFSGHASILLILSVSIGLAVIVTLCNGIAIGELVFARLAGATGQQSLVATVGLAIFMNEFMRLAQGTKSIWTAGLFNAPILVAKSLDFDVTTTRIAPIITGIAVCCGISLLIVMARTAFGRQWRAYADDPRAAALFGVSPSAIFAKTFAIASGLAGLSGAIITIYYGNLDYSSSTMLGLKALVAAIVGGIGSIPGAFIGGLAIGALETIWSAYFPLLYRDVMIFIVLVGVLIFRPGGLWGYGDLTPRRV